MSIKKFIESVKASLNLNKFEQKGKKKAIKRLLQKLESRKEILARIHKKKLNKKDLKELREEQEIVDLQIKKGKKLLSDLDG